MSKNQFAAKVLMYRYQNEGLEVFIEKNEDGEWTFPDFAEGDIETISEQIQLEAGQDDHIELDPVTCEARKRDVLAYAFEIDWRKLPEESLRRQFLETNKGAFIVVKEALKKNMPTEYKMLKELVDVLSIRNIIKNL
jgi:methyl coenzyme M reductase gamma subunit